MANAEKFPGLCTPDESYHGLTYVKAFGKMGYTTKLVAQLMRDLGSIPSPHNSFLLNLGLQTLHLRMAQHCRNAQRVAEFLHDEPKVAWVHYCGLPDDANYALGQKYLPNGSCGVIAFGLKGSRETAIEFMDSLKMINIVTHVADARTEETVIHWRQNQDLFSGHRQGFDNSRNGWHHSRGILNPFPFDVPLVSALIPVDDAVIIAVGYNRIAEDSMFHTFSQCLANGGCSLEVHVCYPQGDE